MPSQLNSHIELQSAWRPHISQDLCQGMTNGKELNIPVISWLTIIRMKWTGGSSLSPVLGIRGARSVEAECEAPPIMINDLLLGLSKHVSVGAWIVHHPSDCPVGVLPGQLCP